MKHGKRPTVKQCQFIKRNGLNPENWFVAKDTPKFMLLVHRHSDSTTRTILKEKEPWD